MAEMPTPLLDVPYDAPMPARYEPHLKGFEMGVRWEGHDTVSSSAPSQTGTQRAGACTGTWTETHR